MRLYLLPISTRRALIYCEPRSHQIPVGQKSYVERAVDKANSTWADWEKNSDSTFNWKKRTTEYGNMMFRKIPFEEWGLKTIPFLKKKDKELYAANSGSERTPRPGSKVVVLYPRAYQSLCDSQVLDTVEHLTEGRRVLHRNRMYGSVAAMPLTIPFGLIPM